MQAEKVKRVVDMAAPISKDSVRSFVGMAGYYCRFINGFAELEKPLTMMLVGKAAFQ